MNPRSRRTGLMPGSYSGANSSYSYYPTYYSTPFFSSGYSGGYSSYYSRGSSYSSGSTAPSSYSAGNDCSRLAREAVRDLQASRTRYRGSKTDSELTLGETGFLCGLIHTQSLMLEEWRFCFYHQSQQCQCHTRSAEQVCGAVSCERGECDQGALQGQGVHTGTGGGDDFFNHALGTSPLVLTLVNA